MNNFKNLKIAITDETHLKAVCEVLESMGYKRIHKSRNPSVVLTGTGGGYGTYMDTTINEPDTTLLDLLKMRDDMVKANAKSS
ncbi:MAG: hypothetical protein RR282_00590 [Acinetobacter sp.]